MRILLDTNIFIYFAAGTLPAELIKTFDGHYASITLIEALGYHNLTVREEVELKKLFAAYVEVTLSPRIVERAIAIRRQKNCRLGDAIIAASAIEYNLVLWTANIEDFAGIENLQLHNPLGDA